MFNAQPTGTVISRQPHIQTHTHNILVCLIIGLFSSEFFEAGGREGGGGGENDSLREREADRQSEIDTGNGEREKDHCMFLFI